MYWPIGAPRTYAATKLEHHDEQQTTSDDGSTTPTLQNRSLEKEHKVESALDDEEGREEKAQSNGCQQKRFARRQTEVDSGKEALESSGTYAIEVENNVGGQIVGMAVARSGHMFITITSSTLTVWQTKVSFVSKHVGKHTANTMSTANCRSCLSPTIATVLENLRS